MDYENMLGKIVEELNILESMYDYIRIVDPVQKKAHYHLKENVARIDDITDACFHFWERGAECENCTSARALYQGDTFVKLEYKKERVNMIMSVPVAAGENKTVVELIKDVTNSGIIDIDGKDLINVYKILDKKNRTVITDAISRVFNETYIYERLPYDIYRSREENISLSLIYLSLNNLQFINEIHGYSAGDLVIRDLARLIKDYCRDSRDWTARYSGTSFILVLNDTDEKKAYQVCRRLYNKTNKTEFTYEKKSLKIDVSIGCDVLTKEIATAEELIKKASRRIYTETEDEKTEKNLQTPEKHLAQYQFTARETEIATLLLKGKSNTEIAKELFVGLSTVKKHISAIFDKINVKSRAEFIAVYRTKN